MIVPTVNMDESLIYKFSVLCEHLETERYSNAYTLLMVEPHSEKDTYPIEIIPYKQKISISNKITLKSFYEMFRVADVDDVRKYVRYQWQAWTFNKPPDIADFLKDDTVFKNYKFNIDNIVSTGTTSLSF